MRQAQAGSACGGTSQAVATVGVINAGCRQHVRLTCTPCTALVLFRRVYQKAYLELFVAPEQYAGLIAKLQVGAIGSGDCSQG